MNHDPFGSFLDHFSPDPLTQGQSPPELPEWATGRIKNWSNFVDRFSGCTFSQGVYRVHSAESATAANMLVAERAKLGLTELPLEFACFASDWLGRQFILEVERLWNNEPSVCLIDLVTLDVYGINATFETFHNEILVRQANDALDINMFREWAKINPELVPLRSTQIVGYRIPLSLGGEHELSNLELANPELELEFNLQIHEQIKDLPEGTPIKGVKSGPAP
jgi:hypothetical protein